MSSRGWWQTHPSWIFCIRGKSFISRRRMLHLLWACQPSFPPSSQRKPFFSSSTSSPVNLPICFYLLPDSPLPHSPYSRWTAQYSPPASSSPSSLPMAAVPPPPEDLFPQVRGWLTLGSLSLRFVWRPASGLREIPNRPCSSADSPTPRHSLPPTHRLLRSNPRTQSATTQHVEASVLRDIVRGGVKLMLLLWEVIPLEGTHPHIRMPRSRHNSSLMSGLLLAPSPVCALAIRCSEQDVAFLNAYAVLRAETLQNQGHAAIKMLATDNEWEPAEIKEGNKTGADMINIGKIIVGVNQELASSPSYRHTRVRKDCLKVKADLWKLMKKKDISPPQPQCIISL